MTVEKLQGAIDLLMKAVDISYTNEFFEKTDTKNKGFEKMLNERIKAMEVSQQQALLEQTRAELERARAEVQELRAHQGGDVNMVG